MCMCRLPKEALVSENLRQSLAKNPLSEAEKLAKLRKHEITGCMSSDGKVCAGFVNIFARGEKGREKKTPFVVCSEGPIIGMYVLIHPNKTLECPHQSFGKDESQTELSFSEETPPA